MIEQTEAEIRQLFNNHSDCYADTHWYSDETIPPIKVEGDVVSAITEDGLIGMLKGYKIIKL